MKDVKIMMKRGTEFATATLSIPDDCLQYEPVGWVPLEEFENTETPVAKKTTRKKANTKISGDDLLEAMGEKPEETKEKKPEKKESKGVATEKELTTAKENIKVFISKGIIAADEVPDLVSKVTKARTGKLKECTAKELSKCIKKLAKMVK